MTNPPLDPWRFDSLIERPPVTPSTEKILWGVERIAKRIRTSPDFVRDTLAKIDGSPVRKIGGRFCAIEADLIAFFRAKPTSS